jgi:hypothetical protein
MLQSFIRSSRLKSWLAKPDCPPAIRECKRLFDALFSSHFDELPIDDIASTPQIPGNLRRFKYDGIIYATSATHLGNSLILYYPNGDRSQSPVPGSIAQVFSMAGKTTCAVLRHLPPSPGTVNPFRSYPDFPINVYSSKLASIPEGVDVEWIFCHFARYPISEAHIAVVALSRVTVLNSMLLAFVLIAATVIQD